MRGFINPHQSSAHRVACLALYRGLLQQAARLNDVATGSAISGHVKRRFKLDKSAQSISVICDGLSLGRKYLDIVREAANGSASATTKLQETLAAVEKHSHELKALRVHQAKLRGPTRPSKLKKIAHLQKTRHKQWAARIPHPIPIWERPVPKERLPNPDKPRRVPHLAAGHGIPFLRYKSGSQPIELSRVIHSRHQRETNRWTNMKRLKEEISHAVLEDNWDSLVEQGADCHDGTDDRESSTSWTSPILESERDLAIAARESTNKRRDTAERMFEIAKQEEALAIRERGERRRLAEQKSQEKRQEINTLGATTQEIKSQSSAQSLFARYFPQQ